MAEPLVVCIRTDAGSSIEAVAELRDGLAQHLHEPHLLTCLTDQPGDCDGVMFIDIREMGLPGSWAKLLLFEPQWRGLHRIIFFDLDVTIVGDLAPLAAVPGEFATYGTSVMVIGGGMAGFVWSRFDAQRQQLMARHGGGGACIAALYPHPPQLKRLLPKGFFSGPPLAVGLPPA